MSTSEDVDETVEGAASPEELMALAHGFMDSKVLLTAVELGVFTELAKGPASAEQLCRRLDLHPRGAADFFDALVALRVLRRRDGVYSNGPAADELLDAAKDGYIGGAFEMMSWRQFALWGRLREALRTGRHQNEAIDGGDIFAALYSDPERLRAFQKAMTGLSLPSTNAIAERLPWSRYRSVADIGCAEGGLVSRLVARNPRLTGVGFDLPAVEPSFAANVDDFGLADRLRFVAGDFFVDPLPTADVLVMGHLLHDWDLETKKMLLAKAFEALPSGGVLVAYDAIIDDDRATNVRGLVMSLIMLLDTTGGFDYTGAEAHGWFTEAGFTDVRTERLAGPESMVVGTKP